MREKTARRRINRGALPTPGLATSATSATSLELGPNLSAAAVESSTAVTNALKTDALKTDAVTINAEARPQAPCAIIVDDDPELGRALARFLWPELQVHVAASVTQGVALVSRLERIDVAFVDLELPDGSGEAILEKLSRWPDAIRVLISGRVLDGENPLKNRALANLVLAKPVATHVLEALKRATLALPRG